MPTQTANLFTLEDLEDTRRTYDLAERDLDALRSVANWIRSFVARPHRDIGRAGPVCPFVNDAMARKTLWLAPEHVAGQSVPDAIQLVTGYKRQLLAADPIDGEDAIDKSIVVVFSDLSTDRARELFDGVLQHLGIPSYANDGLVLGPFYETNKGTAIYNANFRPFTPPVPFLLIRPAVVSDWKFFLDKDEWLDVWAHRFGASAVRTLAEELRRLPWRSPAHAH